VKLQLQNSLPSTRVMFNVFISQYPEYETSGCGFCVSAEISTREEKRQA